MKKIVLALSLVAPLFALPAHGQDSAGFVGTPERTVQNVVSPRFSAPALVAPREFSARTSAHAAPVGDGLSARDRQDLELINNR
jgi:hypothetical protein